RPTPPRPPPARAPHGRRDDGVRLSSPFRLLVRAAAVSAGAGEQLLVLRRLAGLAPRPALLARLVARVPGPVGPPPPPPGPACPPPSASPSVTVPPAWGSPGRPWSATTGVSGCD